MRKNSIKVLAMALSMTLGLCACSSQQPDPQPQQEKQPITLIEPIGSTVSYETVNRRNLYDAIVLSATVTPSIKEYTFEKDSVFGEYKTYLGQQVRKGDLIVSANTDKLDEQIKDLKKQIADMETNYLEYDKEVREALAEPMEDCKRRKDIVETLERNKQEEYLPDGTPNPEYAKWAADYNEWTGKYRILDHQINMQLEDLNQRKALYELDHKYALTRLQSMNQQKKDAGIVADCDGEVVAIRFVDSGYNYPGIRTQRDGDWVSENTTVIAVGDSSQKILQTDYIARDKVRGVKDLYALIDGVRYEVTYQPMDTEEYTRRSAQGKVYSSFIIEGDTSNINFGDFAVITIVTDKREDVISVSREALQSDGSSKYVYKMVDGQSVSTPVKTGMTDGVYTEILSGVEVGDQLQIPDVRQYGTNRATVKKGSSHNDFNEQGILYYPNVDFLKNTVKHGTVYFQEFLVSNYQHVQKGDVIAVVRVKGDSVELQRAETQLNRLVERKEDFKKTADLEDKGVQKRLASMEEQEKELRETVAEIKKDVNTKEIKATSSGVILNLPELKKEDIIQYDRTIAEIAEESSCYIIILAEKPKINFGNTVEVTYDSKQGQKKTVKATISNIASEGLSPDLQINANIILLPTEVIEDMSTTSLSYGDWWRATQFPVTAVTREMDNVLVVPKKAVKTINNRTYVNCIDKTGNVVPVPFIAGGYNNTEYWIIEGLTEGMEVCLE